jgi:hypothetical protein
LSCCETAQSDAGRNVAAWSNVRRFMAGILAEGVAERFDIDRAPQYIGGY